MSATALSRTIREHQIKTVLNLRGPNLGESWYRDEIAATLASGATQVDLSLSSCVWMSRIQLRALVRMLDTCDHPLIMHCAWGSERTGLASAITELLRPGGTLASARDQLVLRHLYVRLGDGKIMAEFVDQYADWLRRNRLEHSPEVFRRWVAEGYVPGKPSREAWPYDPAPLVVVTHPRASSGRLARREVRAGSSETRAR
ncbi:MAG: tyrosine-protein phosphatase [Isosphaeraceae bacterium]